MDQFPSTIEPTVLRTTDSGLTVPERGMCGRQVLDSCITPWLADQAGRGFGPPIARPTK